MTEVPVEVRAELAATVRALLARHCDSAAVRRDAGSSTGYDPALWSLLCEQVGVAGLAVPEIYGGAGFGFSETAVVLEELGAALAPTPYLGSAVLSAQALLLLGDEDARSRLLPGIAQGSQVAALSWADPAGWPTTAVPVRARRDGDGWILSGTAHYVLDAEAAHVLLALAAAPDGVALFEVPAATVRPTPSMDQTLRLGRVEFHDAAATRLSAAPVGDLAPLLDLAAVAVSALQVGAAQRCLDRTVDYSRQRVQFGRPIGSFQALKHRMADMLVDVETSRSICWAAARAIASGSADAPRLAATAKVWSSEALWRTAAEAVQLHGGIAITWEHDAQLYLKRAHALGQLFGTTEEHRRHLEVLHGLA